MSMRLEVSGHAGQAEMGKDIVCSAVSILTYTLAATIEGMELDKQADHVEVKLESGDAVIQAHCRDSKAFDSMTQALHVIGTGYRLIEQNYPEYVQVIKA